MTDDHMDMRRELDIVFTKSVLMHREIHGIMIGGEKRLLFSEIVYELRRRGVSMGDVFEKLRSLHLQLAEVTLDQRSIIATHLGQTSESFNEQYLIRQTDAERLCGAVIPLHKLASDADLTVNTFKVQHEIFGKSRGLFIPELYTKSSAECITCIQCRALLSPQDFVRHNHSPPKNQVRHWGLESTRWSRYVFVAKDQENREHYQRLLEELKQRYSGSDVATLPANADTASSSLDIKVPSNNTTTSIFSQLAALQSDDAEKQPHFSAFRSFSSLNLQRQQFYESLRNLDAQKNSSVSARAPSFAELMASAVAAAAAVAVVKSAATTETPNLMMVPPNIKLNSSFKTPAYHARNDGDDDLPSLKRRRLEVDIESVSPISSTDSVSAAENNSGVNEAALRAIAAINSHARFQSETASVLPARVLLGDSKPVLAPAFDDAPNVSADSGGEESRAITEDSDSKSLKLLQQHIDQEMDVIKRALVAKSGSPDVQHNICDSSTTEESAYDQALAEFKAMRTQHHVEMASEIRQRSAAAATTTTPKHMAMMGKYLGELTMEKADLESRIRQLVDEVSKFKEERNALTQRLVQKEREADEMRSAFNSMLMSGSGSNHPFSSATLSALTATLLGSSSAPESGYPLDLAEAKRNLWMMMMMNGDKMGKFSAPNPGYQQHTQDELNIAMAMASSSSSASKEVASQ